MNFVSSDILMRQYFSQFKGNLLKGFIHNLNSPLQNVSFALEFIKEDLKALSENKLRNYCVEKVEVIFSQFASISNMVLFIRQLDYMAREKNPVIINEFAETIKEVLKCNLFCKHHVELEVQISEDATTSIIPGNIFVPVVCQLLDNALKALRASAGTKKLRISMDAKSLQIADTGCGLHHIGDVEKIFEYGLTKWPPELESHDEVVSAGLGLYWVREILQFLGCRISVFMENSSITVAKINFP